VAGRALRCCSLVAVAVALAAPSALATPLTTARAVGIANAINLRPADVPGFYPQPGTGGLQPPTQAGAALSRCAGGAGPAFADVSSPKFTRGRGFGLQQIGSSADLYSTTAATHTDLAAILRPRGPTCIERFLLAAVGSGTSNSSVQTQITRIASPAAGTDGSFGYRFIVTVKANASKVTMYFDFLGAVAGRIEISLATLSFAAPMPPALEQRLFALLVTRSVARRTT
jgi:hypothetical protein